MSLLSLFSPNDPEIVKQTVNRLDEQDKWNDVFSTKLIELLDKIDAIKAEIRQRLRAADERIQRAQSVGEAEEFLLEEAAKAEDLANKLAKTQETLDAVRLEFRTARDHYRGAEGLRAEAEEILAQAELKFGSALEQVASATTAQRTAGAQAKSAKTAYIDSCQKLDESSTAFAMARDESAKATDALKNASERLATAKRSEFAAAKKASEAQVFAERAAADLGEARRFVNDADTSLRKAHDLAISAKRDLDEACTRQIKAAQMTSSVIRVALSAVSVSWIAVSWAGALVMRTRTGVMTASTLSALLLIATVTVWRKVTIEA